MKHNETLLWENKFGDDYQKRNIVTEQDLDQRIKAWAAVLQLIHNNEADDKFVPSFAEIGAGQGQNLMAIHHCYETINVTPTLTAVEPNTVACEELARLPANIAIVNNSIEGLDVSRAIADVVFTSGVLIHIDPERGLKDAMDKIYKSAGKYVVCMEYFSPQHREIPYRGVKNSLWAGDFGGMYLDNYGLRCIGYFFFWKRVSGLDNLTCWVFKKTD